MGCKRVWAALLGVWLAGPVLAVFKCTGSDGRVTYTDGPCTADSRVQAIDVPPPLSSREEAEARRRGERLLDEARTLDARRTADAVERQRRWEAERQAETAQQREPGKDDADRWGAVYPAPIYARCWPPVKSVQPKPKPVQQERPALIRAYPFR